MTRRRKVLAGVAGLALILGAGLAPAVPSTDAGFTSDRPAAATITAGTLMAPVIDGYSSCFSGLLGGLLGLGKVTVAWHWNIAEATGIPSYANFDGTRNVEWSFDNGATWTAGVVSRAAGAGKFTTEFSSTLVPALGTILGGILSTGSGALTFHVRTALPDSPGWVSGMSGKGVKATLGLLSSRCDVI